MPSVRVVGRRRSNERCVICHGALREQATTCPGCRATAHADCRAELGRCPTIGCMASGKTAAAVAATPLDRDLPTARHRIPPAWARVGPYSRLLVSGLLSTLVALAGFALMLWPILSWKTFHHSAFTDESLHPATGQGIFAMLGIYGLGGLFTYLCSQWVLRIPAVFREVKQLLDTTEPIPMRLQIVVTGSGSDEKRTAKLVGGGHALELAMGGMLDPGWLGRMPTGTRCYVYGLPPPGPYLIEVPDGRLALFHPD